MNSIKRALFYCLLLVILQILLRSLNLFDAVNIVIIEYVSLFLIGFFITYDRFSTILVTLSYSLVLYLDLLVEWYYFLSFKSYDSIIRLILISFTYSLPWTFSYLSKRICIRVKFFYNKHFKMGE